MLVIFWSRSAIFMQIQEHFETISMFGKWGQLLLSEQNTLNNVIINEADLVAQGFLRVFFFSTLDSIVGVRILS